MKDKQIPRRQGGQGLGMTDWMVTGKIQRFKLRA